MQFVSLSHGSFTQSHVCLAYQKRGSAAGHICGRLVLNKVESQVGWQIIVPRVQLRLEAFHLLKGKLVGGCGRVVLLKNASKDPTRPEESQGAREAGRLAREGRLEALFCDVFVISISRVLSVNVFLLQQLGESKSGGSKAANC